MDYNRRGQNVVDYRPSIFREVSWVSSSVTTRLV
jgi:hypothetical protein